MTARVTVYPKDYALELTLWAGALPGRTVIAPKGPEGVNFWIPMNMTVTLRAAPDVSEKESEA